MKLHHSIKFLSVLVTLLITGLTAMPVMAEYSRISGAFKSVKYTKQEVIPVPQSQGHIIMLTNATTMNTDTSDTGFMSGANVVISEIVDLEQGNGPSRGYVTFTMKNGDEIVCEIRGDISTSMSANGHPDTGFTGKWSYISGQGKYANITGSGNYQGHFVAQDEFVVDWNGYYFLE